MPKFTPERAKELLPIPTGLFKPSINGKTKYQRIPIAHRSFVAIRHDNRLFIGQLVLGEIMGLHEVHPDTIPKTILPNGTVREIKFGEQYQIGVFEFVEKPEYVDDDEDIS